MALDEKVIEAIIREGRNCSGDVLNTHAKLNSLGIRCGTDIVKFYLQKDGNYFPRKKGGAIMVPRDRRCYIAKKEGVKYRFGSVYGLSGN